LLGGQEVEHLAGVSDQTPDTLAVVALQILDGRFQQILQRR
jgi:hypothetical protein